MLLMFSFQSADFSFNWRLGDFSEFSRDGMGEGRWGGDWELRSRISCSLTSLVYTGATNSVEYS